MRQTKTLLLTRFHPKQQVFAGCCQSLLGDGPSRRYLCRSFTGCLDPYPGGFLWCIYPFLPIETSDSPPVRTMSAFPQHPAQRLRCRTLISGLQSFTNVQTSSFARHSGRSHHTTQCSYSSRDFYIRSYHSLLPPCAPDILSVRTGQLTAGDFHPIKPTALSDDPSTQSSNQQCYSGQLR